MANPAVPPAHAVVAVQMANGVVAIEQASSLAHMMQNNASCQHNGQTISTAATAQVCSLMIAVMPTGT